MKIHSFTKLRLSTGAIDEVYTFDGDSSKLEEFLEGTQYNFVEKIRSTAMIQHIRNPQIKEQILVGTHLIKSFDRRDVCFIYDGSLHTGYCKNLTKLHLKQDDPLYGLDIRGWTTDFCRVIDKDGNFKSVSITELGQESEWLSKYTLVILNKNEWVKFKESRKIELDDEKWKPVKPIVEY